MSENYTRRNVIITGGSGGIGSAICARLINEGHAVTVIDRVIPAQTDVAYVPADLGSPGAADEAVTRAALQGSFDAIVNAIGYYGCSTLETFSWEEFAKSMQVNGRAPIEAILAWLRYRSSGVRSIAINIGSAGARLGSRDLAYAMSKAALEGGTKSLARSLAPLGITVIGIAPGIIDTPMSAGMPDWRRREHVQSTLLGRSGCPEEVADLVMYLLLGKSDYMTGSIVNLSCGLV